MTYAIYSETAQEKRIIYTERTMTKFKNVAKSKVEDLHKKIKFLKRKGTLDT